MAQILIVENNAADARTLQLMLDFAAHEVELVTRSQHALELMQRGTVPDAVITALFLPDMDGCLLARAIKQNSRSGSVPVLLTLPPDTDGGIERLALRAGVSAMLQKPFERDVLLAELDRTMLMAPVQPNPLAKANPDEELLYLRDYNGWLSQMLTRTSAQAQQTRQTLGHVEAHLAAINQVTAALGTTLEVEETLQTLGRKAAELTRAQAVAIYEYEDGHSYLQYLASHGGPALPELSPELVIEQGSPLIYLTLGNQALRFEQQNLATVRKALNLPPSVTSAILSPMVAEGALIGIIVVLRVGIKEAFQSADADTLLSLASAAGLALRNARLFSNLEEAYTDLQALDRRKSEFVAITSHELRTPIAIMLGYASLLSESEQNPDRKAQLQTIEKQANFLASMVDVLLNLHELQNASQPITLRCEPFSVQQMLMAAHNAALANHKHPEEFQVTIDADPIIIRGDEVRLTLAFSNLIDNALKFSPETKAARVSIAPLPNGGVIITVEDQGIGIPAGEFENIFQPFHQLEESLTRRYGGMGLGLAIVKGIIELHNGEIELRSVIGEGSRFIITLPPAPPPERCQSY